MLQHELSRAIVPKQPNAEHPLMDGQVELIPDHKDFNQEHYYATRLFFSGTESAQEPNLNNLPKCLKDQLSKERSNCNETYDRDIEHVERKRSTATIKVICRQLYATIQHRHGTSEKIEANVALKSMRKHRGRIPKMH